MVPRRYMPIKLLLSCNSVLRKVHIHVWTKDSLPRTSKRYCKHITWQTPIILNRIYLGCRNDVVKQLPSKPTLGCFVGNISYLGCSETFSAGAGLSWCSTIDVFACISISCMKRPEARNHSKSKRKAETFNS